MPEQWTRSSRSAENGCCVEARLGPTAEIRDSKDPDGDVLTFDAGSWRAFIRMVAARES